MVSVSVRRNPPEPVGRNARPTYPHPENPGLIEQVDGFYDWADRRLFLADGSPDPATPGAYRYQSRPDLCDLAAPASNPASPCYEPPHLRHRPGDTWIIDRSRPHDPDDPGSFGSPGWRPDSRTGRHRRDELPDPIPPWEREPSPERAEESSSAPERPPVRPRRPPRFWQEDEGSETGSKAPQEESFQFETLRERAWDRFMIKSAPLAAAHWADRRALHSRHLRLAELPLRLFRWVAAVFTCSRAERLVEAGACPQRHPLAVVLQRAAKPQTASVPHEEALVAVPPQQAATASQPLTRGFQLAQAVRGAQSARAARADGLHGTERWCLRPHEERRRRPPLPYMVRWGQAFDAHRGFGEAVAL
jgi:hypothetical protein